VFLCQFILVNNRVNHGAFEAEATQKGFKDHNEGL